MNKNLKDRWVAALRSGNYKQGAGALKRDCPDGDEYCCLGVLWDIDRGVWNSLGDICSSQYGHAGSLPMEYWDRLGVGIPQKRFAGMNDTGESFSKIADYIEQNVPED